MGGECWARRGAAAVLERGCIQRGCLSCSPVSCRRGDVITPPRCCPQEGLTGALCGLGTPDICFVFVSCKSHENLPAMLRALRGRLAACTVLAGVVAPGILGKDTGER